ncbi:hypothetical protein EKT70_05960 [Stenotrophomonas geniculata]|uniref:hypothetical protein n=1 Tax=Stenotrophomonas geniculata TaxID=86188 RepID=UPI000F841ED8|nr:hypothetical protein [Stenotrophomonas geniculata]RTY14782.1 hypothetical protein EKT70_05960 [Stenotrophomonas geniculata]
MSRFTCDEKWWLETLEVVEWNAFEEMIDFHFPPPRDYDAPRWYYPRIDWRAVLVVLNRISALGQERQVARALSTNFSKPLTIDAVSRLFEVLDRSIRLFHKVATTQVERKRRARVIAQAARTLAEELSSVSCQSDLRLARFLLSEAEGRNRRLPIVAAERYEDLAAVADKMTEIPKVVGSPGSPNAHKLYCLRELTDYLAANYGRPMRSLVLVLAGLYFDVSDMTTNDLAKYAPVKKDTKRGRLFSPLNFR